MADKIRVLIVDDSALARETLKNILSADPLIEVIGEAKDGKEGVQKAHALKPDVITMDLKMPMMSGLEAIEEIMENIPIPIIVVSSMDRKVIVNALSVGAMDFVPLSDQIDEIAKELTEKVRIASKIRPLRRFKIRPIFQKESPAKKIVTNKVVAIGISTGGPQALQVLLNKLPGNFGAGILVVQHIANGFVEGLADWLKTSSCLDICIAKAGDVIKNQTVFFAPDNYNMVINDNGTIGLKEDIAKKSFHCPSIDEMMKSVAGVYGSRATGVLMTGMGSDGVEGMKAIKYAGGVTLAQNEATSVIFGMNKMAIDKGYVDKVLPLENIAQELVYLVGLA